MEKPSIIYLPESDEECTHSYERTDYWCDKFIEAEPTLRVLRLAREALLMAAPSIDQRSPTWREMKRVVDAIDGVVGVSSNART